MNSATLMGQHHMHRRFIIYMRYMLSFSNLVQDPGGLYSSIPLYVEYSKVLQPLGLSFGPNRHLAIGAPLSGKE